MSLLALSLAVFTSSALATTVSGIVTDRTTGKPSKGDTVAVINTAQSMDEIAKVTTDAEGKFQVNAPDGGQILLHVTHSGAEYFKSVPPGTSSVDIDVYDSAPKIDGIAGEALVFRAETDASGKTLNVTENFFLQNASAPPKTQFGGNTFDFFLPAGAQITQTVASGPSGLPTNVEIKTVDKASGHYAFTFPIRPGENRFQVGYTLPYSGKQDFTIKLTVPTGDVAVMLPKSMQFQGQGATQFQSISPDVNAQTYDAHTPAFGQPIQFTLAGTGQLPQQQEQPQGAGQQGAMQGGQQQASSERPGGGLGAPGDPEAENDPWSKYKWWIVGLLGLALAGGAGVMLRRSALPADRAPLPPTDAVDPFAPEIGVPPYPGTTASYTPPTSGYTSSATRPTTSTLQALKDELFELEADRITGRITAAEYEQHKAAFDVVLRRALSRIEAGSTTSNV